MIDMGNARALAEAAQRADAWASGAYFVGGRAHGRQALAAPAAPNPSTEDHDMAQHVGPTVGKGWGDDSHDSRYLRRQPGHDHGVAQDMNPPRRGGTADMRARTMDVSADERARRRAKAKAQRQARRKGRR